MKVDRHSLLTHALRHSVALKFWPLDPPRPPSQGSQVCAQTKHVFSSGHGGFSSLFRNKSDKGSDGTVIVEARLPRPVILIPGQPIPITLITKRDSGYMGTVIIQSVEILLGIITTVRIQGNQSNDRDSVQYPPQNEFKSQPSIRTSRITYLPCQYHWQWRNPPSTRISAVLSILQYYSDVFANSADGHTRRECQETRTGPVSA